MSKLQYIPSPRLGQLQMGRLLGKGAYGAVFEVTQGDKKYALKQQSRIEDRERALMESFVQKRFTNLVNTLDFFQIYGQWYICMEYCEKNLYERIKKFSTFKSDEFRYMARQITNGVKELHDLNLIHRDLKPENICEFTITDNRGTTQLTYKICDFGLSKEQDIRMTQNQGTPYYQAPEQITAESYDKSVDIWALGCIFYELMTGKPFFNGRTQQEIQRIIQNTTQQEIDQKIDQIPALDIKYKYLIKQMIIREPQKRINIHSILKELQPAISRSVDVHRVEKSEKAQFQQVAKIQQVTSPSKLLKMIPQPAAVKSFENTSINSHLPQQQKQQDLSQVSTESEMNQGLKEPQMEQQIETKQGIPVNATQIKNKSVIVVRKQTNQQLSNQLVNYQQSPQIQPHHPSQIKPKQIVEESNNQQQNQVQVSNNQSKIIIKPSSVPPSISKPGVQIQNIQLINNNPQVMNLMRESQNQQTYLKQQLLKQQGAPKMINYAANIQQNREAVPINNTNINIKNEKQGQFTTKIFDTKGHQQQYDNVLNNPKKVDMPSETNQQLIQQKPNQNNYFIQVNDGSGSKTTGQQMNTEQHTPPRQNHRQDQFNTPSNGRSQAQGKSIIKVHENGLMNKQVPQQIAINSTETIQQGIKHNQTFTYVGRR